MRITVTVPQQINVTNALELEADIAVLLARDVPGETLHEVKHSFSRVYGGFTMHEAFGGWVNPDGELVEERVTVVEAYTDHPTGDQEAYWIARFVRSALYQDAAMYTVDNEAYFIDD